MMCHIVTRKPSEPDDDVSRNTGVSGRRVRWRAQRCATSRPRHHPQARRRSSPICAINGDVVAIIVGVICRGRSSPIMLAKCPEQADVDFAQRTGPPIAALRHTSA
jgi:hypothetical protein